MTLQNDEGPRGEPGAFGYFQWRGGSVAEGLYDLPDDAGGAEDDPQLGLALTPEHNGYRPEPPTDGQKTL